MDALETLLDQMEKGEIVPRLLLEADEIEEALNRRDAPAFDNEWMRAFRNVEARRASLDRVDARVDRLRELAYRQAFQRWKSPDLAGYLSDDFGLIGLALVTGSEDELAIAMLSEYRAFRFPTEFAATQQPENGIEE